MEKQVKETEGAVKQLREASKKTKATGKSCRDEEITGPGRRVECHDWAQMDPLE